MIGTWREAEAAAAQFMRQYLGFADAWPTGRGSDGGVDVHAHGAVAQVKHHSKPVGRPDLQRLVGARPGGACAVFFSLSGFTATARTYAHVTEMALFQYSAQGNYFPASDRARALLDEHRPRRAATPLDSLDRDRSAGDEARAAVRERWLARHPTGGQDVMEDADLQRMHDDLAAYRARSAARRSASGRASDAGSREA